MTPSNEAWALVIRALAIELARELAPLLADALRATAAPPATTAAPAEYLSVNETCEKYGFSRGTFDRMLRDPKSGLVDVVVRVPPVTGRVKVPTVAFEAWLNGRGKARRSGAAS